MEWTLAFEGIKYFTPCLLQETGWKVRKQCWTLSLPLSGSFGNKSEISEHAELEGWWHSYTVHSHYNEIHKIHKWLTLDLNSRQSTTNEQNCISKSLYYTNVHSSPPSSVSVIWNSSFSNDNKWHDIFISWCIYLQFFLFSFFLFAVHSFIYIVATIVGNTFQHAVAYLCNNNNNNNNWF